jgi:hypothetical protein
MYGIQNYHRACKKTQKFTVPRPRTVRSQPPLEMLLRPTLSLKHVYVRDLIGYIHRKAQPISINLNVVLTLIVVSAGRMNRLWCPLLRRLLAPTNQLNGL